MFPPRLTDSSSPGSLLAWKPPGCPCRFSITPRGGRSLHAHPEVLTCRRHLARPGDTSLHPPWIRSRPLPPHWGSLPAPRGPLLRLRPRCPSSPAGCRRAPRRAPPAGPVGVLGFMAHPSACPVRWRLRWTCFGSIFSVRSNPLAVAICPPPCVGVRWGTDSPCPLWLWDRTVYPVAWSSLAWEPRWPETRQLGPARPAQRGPRLGLRGAAGCSPGVCGGHPLLDCRARP